jgi:phage-related protein
MARRLFRKAVQQGRSERRGESYSVPYAEPLSDARTPLADFVNSLLGDSLICLREFPEDARHDAGYQLDKVQRGEQPDDFKPMPSIGKGVEEIRVRDDTGVYRVVYTARLADAVYVLHAFQKKTQATAKRDIELANKRFTELMRGAQ